jgi:hypothetical protein
MEWEFMDRIHLTQDTIKGQAADNMVTIIQVSLKTYGMGLDQMSDYQILKEGSLHGICCLEDKLCA